MSAVSSPAWRAAVLSAIKKNDKHMPYAKYFQLATVKPNGKPANRTVVYRGFLGETAKVTVVTDLRSSKVQELARNAAGEFAWYFPESREQFRVAGELEVIAKDSASMQSERQAAWDRMSPAGRAQFAWPTPGFPQLEEGAVRPGTNKQTFDVPEDVVADGSDANDNFCLVVMRVEEVDHLSLRSNRRFTHVKVKETGEWVTTEVNP
mgnify:CR=1 FL=1